jgi:methionyl-tRNA synthetase
MDTQSDLSDPTDLHNFTFNTALEKIWNETVKVMNKEINEKEPWKLESDQREQYLKQWLKTLHQVGTDLRPFMPETAEKILKATGGKIQKIAPLFPRIAS